MRHLLRGAAAALAVLAAVAVPAPAWADAVRDAQWQLGYLNISQAQRYSTGAGVTVAVIDSGVDASHPDLAGNVLPGPSSDDWTDFDGHGTGMAALIAGHGHGPGNRDGALGIAPEARILPAKDIDIRADSLAIGIEWAIGHGAKVISISKGGNDPYEPERLAVADAIAHDIVVVAAAGNLDQPTVGYPAAYPGVVAVAGVDAQGNHVAGFTTGPQIVLSAPAADIVSAGLQHGYGKGTGTSPSTAIVSGVVALVRAKYPNLSAAEVVHRLTATAIDKGPPGRDDTYGYGIVNPVGALTAEVPPLAQQSASAPASDPATESPAAGRPITAWGIIGVAIALVAVTAFGLIVLVTRRRPA